MGRQLQAQTPPSKTVAYIFMGVIFLALVFFVYNWWRCRQSRVIEQEMEDYNHEYDDNSFKPSPAYKDGNRPSASRQTEEKEI